MDHSPGDETFALFSGFGSQSLDFTLGQPKEQEGEALSRGGAKSFGAGGMEWARGGWAGKKAFPYPAAILARHCRAFG